MSEAKPWYASRTMWVGAAQAAVGVALAAGAIDEATARDALGSAPEVVGGVVTAALAATQIYIRTQTDKPIAGTALDPAKED